MYNLGLWDQAFLFLTIYLYINKILLIESEFVHINKFDLYSVRDVTLIKSMFLLSIKFFYNGHYKNIILEC